MNPFRLLAANIVKESERWPLAMPIGMAAGIIIYFALPFEPAALWLLATPVLAALAFGMRYLYYPAGLVLIALMLAALGFNAAQLETRIDARPMLDRELGPVPMQGRLMLTEIMPDGVRITLKDPTIGHLSPERTPEKIRIRLDDAALADIPPAGAEVSLLGRVGPFSEAVAPGANDFRRQAFFRHLGGLGWVYGAVKLVDPNPPSASWRDDFNLMFEHARQTLAQHVEQRLSGDAAAMTVARLNGQQTGISKPVIDAMRIAGLAHLLSTSGFHVTIMGLLIYFPLRAMLALIPWIALRFNIKKIAAAAAILSAMAYTFLVGAQPATLRSLLMTGLAMLAILTDRRAAPMRIVMLSAMLAMLLAPDAVMGPSFEMSFAAVFCLIAAHENPFRTLPPNPTAFLPPWLDNVRRRFGEILRTSLIATAATTPFAIYHFQSFSLYGFIANMLAIPITSFWVMPCILLAYILAPLHLDGWLIDAAGAGIALTIKIADTVAHWPWSIFYVRAMPGVALIAITLGGLWLCLLQRRWRYIGLVPILFGALYGVYAPEPAIMISGDGKQWAARLDDGKLAVANLDRDAFTVTQWQQRLGNIPSFDVTELPLNSPIAGDHVGCAYRHAGHIIAMPEIEAAALEDCRSADILIAPFVIALCGAKTVIDDPLLWRHGAAEIYFKDNQPVIRYVRQSRGERPWSVGYKTNWKTESPDAP